MVCYDRMVQSWETIDIASSIWNRTTRCRLRPGPRWRYLRSRARRHSRRCCWSAGIELRDGGEMSRCDAELVLSLLIEEEHLPF